jgi:hypothetical protein
MSTWTDEHTTMLDDCIKRESKLTEWEHGFVDSLDHRLGKGLTPTDKQAGVLERIWERVTA